ncbi:hypothetical protein S14_199 [Shewanella sp. phage 1/4]|uniref:hypothetical protein n=1 Tax=Shewanella phage 1/4 TaxID=1458859 RepID=UPI0004F64C1B|nr:hypothetical protein S14_199 [Shewanella sp. phage 1/4]AHK11308.1 hypothetical protein S14_199 [Shewanella sp. phage 1/4]
MIINTNHLSDVLGSVLSHSMSECVNSFALYNSNHHTEAQVAYKRLFNVSYRVIVELQKVIVVSDLSVTQRLELDKIRVFHHTLDKVVDNGVVIDHYTTTPADNRFEDLVWFNRNTGEIEEIS